MSTIEGDLCLDWTIGIILVSTVISAVLFGILSVQVQLYFSKFVHDAFWMKLLVGTVWTVDLAHQFCATAISYDHTISNFSNEADLHRKLWPYSSTILIEPFSSTLVQLFFARRLYLLNPKLWPMAALTVLTCFLTFAAGETTGAMTFAYPNGEHKGRLKWISYMWLGCAAICDILVTAPMIWTLLTFRTGYESTNRLIARMLVWVINTGLLTATLAFLKIFMFWKSPDTMVCMAANIVLAKIYSVSLLAFLNRRGRWQNDKTENSWSDGLQLPTITRNTDGKKPTNHDRSQSNATNDGVRMTISTINYVDIDGDQVGLNLPPDDFEESERQAIQITPERRPYISLP